MTWYAVYQESDGALVSIASSLPVTLAPGLSSRSLADRPELGAEEWDAVTRAFVDRPPLVLTDRLQELLSDAAFADFQTVWSAMNATRRNQLTAALARLLGPRRMRYPTETLVLD